VADIYEGY